VAGRSRRPRQAVTLAIERPDHTAVTTHRAPRRTVASRRSANFAYRTSRKEPDMTTITASRPTRKRLPTRSASNAPHRVAGPDAIAMLRADHKRVDAMFNHFDKIKDEAKPTQKQALVDEICVALTIHTTLEEELLYPAARDALGEKGHELLDEAEVEHATAKDLIAQLESASPGDELYDAKVAVLGEYVRHHVKEEHDEMFPKCRKSGMDLKSLGAQMRERRAALMGDA